MSGFLLDTNIPSESWRTHPASNVGAWLKGQVKAAQFIRRDNWELRKWAVVLPPSAKRTQIEYSIEVLIPAWFGQRVLSVTQMIAERWGALDAQRQQIGRPLGVADGMLAAWALEHDITLVTRNVKDFTSLGVRLSRRRCCCDVPIHHHRLFLRNLSA